MTYSRGSRAGFGESDSNPYPDFITLGCVSLIDCKGQFCHIVKTPRVQNHLYSLTDSSVNQKLYKILGLTKIKTQPYSFKSRVINLSQFARDSPHFSNESPASWRATGLGKWDGWAPYFVGVFGLDCGRARKYATG